MGPNVVPVENLAESLQVAFDAGAKRILLPMASVRDIPTIPGELFAMNEPLDSSVQIWASDRHGVGANALCFQLRHEFLGELRVPVRKTALTRSESGGPMSRHASATADD